MHECDRSDATHRLLQRLTTLVGLHAPGLHAQQRCDRLQVVLDPMMDLADRRILGQQQPLMTTQLGDLAHQHDRTEHPLAACERQEAPQHDRPARLDLRLDRSALLEGRHQRLIIEVEVGQAAAGDVRGHAEPAIGAHRVGRGVADATRRVDADHAVADAGSDLTLRVLPVVGEGALRDHRGQFVRGLQVGELELRRCTDRREVRLARHDGDDLPAPGHRDRLLTDGDTRGPVRLAVTDDRALLEGAQDRGLRRPRERGADEVLLVDGLRRVGTHLGGDDDLRGRRIAHAQQQVGEREVGQDLPVRDQRLDARGRIDGQTGAFLEDAFEGRHVSARGTAAAAAAGSPRGCARRLGPRSLGALRARFRASARRPPGPAGARRRAPCAARAPDAASPAAAAARA